MTRGWTLVGYAVLVLAIATKEVRARRHGRASFGRLVGSLARRPATRWPVLAAWLWLGWHLFARVHWR